MLRVGLTGGIATGKSLVGQELARLGCHLLQADLVGHRLLAAGGGAERAVVAEFGEQILGENGIVDRSRLAGIVFGDPAALERLNAIIHPLVFEEERVWMDGIEALEPQAIAVVEAAILVETGSYRMFEKLIVTWCPEEVSVARAMARSGWREEEVRSRMARQLPIEEKKRFADYLIDSSGSLESTLEQTRAVYAALRSLNA